MTEEIQDDQKWISHTISDLSVGYYNTAPATQQLIERFYTAVKAGTAFIRVVGNHRYNGSIGRVTESAYASYILPDKVNNYYRSSNHYYIRKDTLTAVFDDRKTGFKAAMTKSGFTIEWLEGYTGPTVYAFTKPEARPKVVLPVFQDQLGRDITVGAPCIYVDWNGRINFGKVSKISPRNVVYCTNYKGDKRTYENESRIRDPKECIILLTKDLNDQVVMMRLRTE